MERGGASLSTVPINRYRPRPRVSGARRPAAGGANPWSLGMKKRCSVRGCRRPERAKGLCSAHYQRKRTGKPLEAPIRTKVYGSIAERLAAHLKVDERTDCHLWTGYRDPVGYGRMYINGAKRIAHRIAWEVAHGPIPEGMIVMHAVCDNPPCCNPEHLKLGTQADNARDRVRKGRGPGARAQDLKLHPQWAKRPPRRRLARRPHRQGANMRTERSQVASNEAAAAEQPSSSISMASGQCLRGITTFISS